MPLNPDAPSSLERATIPSPLQETGRDSYSNPYQGLPDPDQYANRPEEGFDTGIEEKRHWFSDMFVGAGHGILGAFEAFTDLGADAGNALITMSERAGLNEVGGFSFKAPELNENLAPHTRVGGLVSGVAQYATAALVVHGVLRGAGRGVLAKMPMATRKMYATAFSGSTRGAKFRRWMAEDAVVGFVAFQEHEARLANLMLQFPWLENPITRFLAADENDSWLEGRLKNVIEGLGVAGAFTGLLMIPRLRSHRKMADAINKNDPEGFVKAAEEAQGPEFQAMLDKAEEGSELLVLHNEDVLKKFFTLVPGMDAAKMQAVMVAFRTAAKQKNFSSLNEWLLKDWRGLTINTPLPRGAFRESFDAADFSNLESIGKGVDGPLGDGTPYALFEGDRFAGIQRDFDNSNVAYVKHDAMLEGQATDVFIVPGMTPDKAKMIARKYNKDTVTTSEGIHHLASGKVAEFRGIKVLEEGAEDPLKGFNRLVDGEGNTLRYNLDYSKAPVDESIATIVGPRSFLAKEAKGSDISLQEVFKFIKKYTGNLDDTKELLAGPPEHILGVGRFIEEQRAILAKGEVEPRSVLKAAIETKSTIQASARTWSDVVDGVEQSNTLLYKLKERMDKGEYTHPVSARIYYKKGKADFRFADQKGAALKWLKERGEAAGDPDWKAKYDSWWEKRHSKLVSKKLDLDIMREQLWPKSNTRRKPELFLDWIQRSETTLKKGGRTFTAPGGKELFEKNLFTQTLEGGGQSLQKIRPEELTGLWLLSPNGKAALDGFNEGKFLGELWEELLQIRGAYGSNQLRVGKFFPDRGQTLEELVTEAAKAGTSKAALKKYTGRMHDIGNITDKINGHVKARAGTWDTNEIAEIVKSIKGIGEAKQGFLKAFIGIGDTFTMDSVMIDYLITGNLNAKSKGIESLKARSLEIRDRINKMAGSERDQVIKKLREKNEVLLKEVQAALKEKGSDIDLNAHMLHHWLWDKIQGFESLAHASEKAMTFAKQRKRGDITAAVSFGSPVDSFVNDADIVMHLFTKPFPDKYGRVYGPTDFTAIIHEFGHIYRRGLDIDSLNKVELELGVVNKNWTRKQEEKFADMFEAWLLKEGPALPGLETEFKNMKNWMEELYKNVGKSPLKYNVTSEVKAAFGRIFETDGSFPHLTELDIENFGKQFDDAVAGGMDPDLAIEQVGFNLNKFDIDTDTKSVMDGISKILSPERLKHFDAGIDTVVNQLGKTVRSPTKGNIVKNTRTLELAENLGINEEALIKQLSKDAEVAGNMTSHLVAGKMLLATYSESVLALAKKVKAGADDEIIGQFHMMTDKLAEVFSTVLRVQRGAARATQSGNIRIKGFDPDTLQQIKDSRGGRDGALKLADDIIKVDAAPSKMQKMQNNRLAWDLVHEFRINGLLSSFKSLTVDLLSTTLHTTLLPAERVIGGLVSGDFKTMKQGAKMYHAMAGELKDSIAIAWKALKTETPIVDPMVRSTELVRHAWTAKRIGQKIPGFEDTATGSFIDFVGKTFIRWPSRLRIGSDELFKQLSYRAHLRLKLMDDAFQKFDIRQTDEIASYVTENFEAAFDSMGKGVVPDSLQYAREITFTEPLKDGWGATIMGMKEKHPAMGLLTPFVRTPTWLFRGFIGRSLGPATLVPGLGKMVAALNPSLKAFRADFLAGGLRRSKSVGKMATAATLYGAAVVLANEGFPLPGGKRVRIIGNGPPDPAKRKLWEQAGYLANSFEITDKEGNKKYYQFDRLDPFAMFLGTAADYVQLGAYLTEEQLKDVSGFMIMTMANRLDGLYFKGAIDAMAAWSQGGGKAVYFGKSMVKSFVPRIFSQNPLAVVPGLGALNDPYRRESESIMGAWQELFPFLWNKFGVQRDSILAKPIEQRKAWGSGVGLGAFSPFSYSESPAEDNPIRKLVDDLKGSVGPMSPIRHGVDTRNIALDEKDEDGFQINNAYQKLQAILSKLPIEKALIELTYSKDWDLAPEEARNRVTKRLLRTFRNTAFKKLLAEDETVREFYDAYHREQAQRRLPVLQSD